MDKLLAPFRQSKLLNTLFLSNVFLSFHYALIIYINSTYLSGFFSEGQISALYIIGAVVTTTLLLNISKILTKTGTYTATIYLLAIEFVSTVGMISSAKPFWIGLYFLAHTVAISALYFNMDIFVESLCTDETNTGSVRATYLTMANITILVAPLVVSILLWRNTYAYVYATSAMTILPLYYLIGKFKNVTEKKAEHIHIRETLAQYIKSSDLYNIFASNFLLQLFYAFMVVYVPLYLEKYIGFAWTEIGVMFTIMLLPFVLFEVPLGELEDSKYGEKEFLTIGFVIIGLSTLFISFITLKNFWLWTVVLFITRIGASFIEISTESYFFKHVDGGKSDVISFFRITRPLSFVTAPLIATIALQFISFQYVFIIVGSLMILGTHYSLAIQDTK